MVQWLGLHYLTAKGLGSIPIQGTKIPQATQRGQNKKVWGCIRKYFELNKNENMSYQNLWDAAKTSV